MLLLENSWENPLTIFFSRFYLFACTAAHTLHIGECTITDKLTTHFTRTSEENSTGKKTMNLYTSFNSQTQQQQKRCEVPDGPKIIPLITRKRRRLWRLYGKDDTFVISLINLRCVHCNYEALITREMLILIWTMIFQCDLCLSRVLTDNCIDRRVRMRLILNFELSFSAYFHHHSTHTHWREAQHEYTKQPSERYTMFLRHQCVVDHPSSWHSPLVLMRTKRVMM